MAITVETLNRLKSQLLTSGIQDKNQALFQVINLLIDGVIQGFGEVNTQVFPSSGGGSGSLSSGTFITYGNDIATLPQSAQLLAGAGIQFNLNGRLLTISAAIPIPVDGIDGIDGEIGPPGPQGMVGATGPMGPPGLDAVCECEETMPFIGNSIHDGLTGNFTQVI